MWEFKGLGGGREGDLDRCAYLWKNPGYAAPDVSDEITGKLQNCSFMLNWSYMSPKH